MIADVTFGPRLSDKIPLNVDDDVLFSLAAAAYDHMQDEAQRTQGSYLPPPKPGEKFTQLIFENDDDVGMYFTTFPCSGQLPVRGQLQWRRRITQARYSDIALAIEGLMDLVHNKAPTAKKVAVVDLGKYNGDMVPIDEVDDKRRILMGMVIWQSKSAPHFLPGGMDYLGGYLCDDHIHLENVIASQ